MPTGDFPQQPQRPLHIVIVDDGRPPTFHGPAFPSALEKELQAVVNDLVCAGWRETFPGHTCYEATISDGLMKRLVAQYRPTPASIT